jgi:hypothetical protein
LLDNLVIKSSRKWLAALQWLLLGLVKRITIFWQTTCCIGGRFHAAWLPASSGATATVPIRRPEVRHFPAPPCSLLHRQTAKSRWPRSEI